MILISLFLLENLRMIALKRVLIISKLKSFKLNTLNNSYRIALDRVVQYYR